MSAGDHIEEQEERYLDFLDRFGGNIWNFSVHTSESHADAEDIMQEIFAAVWQGLPSVPPNPRRENRWLYRVMLSVLTRHLQRRLHLVFMDLSNIPDPSGSDEGGELLDALAAHLADDDRVVLQRLREGYKVHEIADMLGISVPAAHTRVFRLKQKLKKIYEKHYEK